MDDFKEFGKISRLFRPVCVTEKIDGTNAQVHVLEDGQVLAGSRSRYVTPGNDNFGFAAWVKEHEDELRLLGPGRHFGEWYGKGIQRGYGLGERRFALFNVDKWGTERPACCHVVPVLGRFEFCSDSIRNCIATLRAHGSYAAPGFDRPEGVVVYHHAGGWLMKYTFDKNDGHKG